MKKHLLSVILLVFAALFTSAGQYSMEFRSSGTNSDSGEISASEEIFTAGAEYVSSFSPSTIYLAGRDNGLKIGKYSGGGTIRLNLSEEGQQSITKIIATCAPAGTRKAVILTINGVSQQLCEATNTDTSMRDVEFEFVPDDPSQSIMITTDNYMWLKKLVVEYEDVVEEYCIPTDQTNTYKGRYTSALTVATPTNTLVIDNLQNNSTKMDVYWDRTEQMLVVNPGDQVTLVPTAEGLWMHSYLFVDYNRNGVFTPDLDDLSRPLPGSELVTHTGYNKAGEHPMYTVEGVAISRAGYDNYGELKDPLPAFTIPADLAPGYYRARYKVMWNCIDPCDVAGDENNPLGASGGICVDFTIFVALNEGRDVAVSVAEDCADLGKVEIVSPATDDLTVNTTEYVTMRATATDPDAYFVSWTDAEGNVVSEEAEFTYQGSIAAAFTANFRQHFAVMVNDPKNFTKLNGADNKAIASGTLIDKGTELTVVCNPRDMMLVSLLVNEVEVLDLYDNGYRFTVNGPVVIEPTFEAPKFAYTVAIAGEGTVTVTDEIDEAGAPAGVIFTEDDKLDLDGNYYVIAAPAEGWMVESFTVGDELVVVDRQIVDEDYTSEYCKTIAFEYYVMDETAISVKFVIDESAIDSILVNDTDSCEIYTLQGVRIDGAAIIPGLYILRDAQGARKVYIK